MTDERAVWSPPDGYDYGEGTQQARALRDDADEDEAPEWWTDSYELRMRFGISEFDRSEHPYDIYVDSLIHEKPARTTSTAGGTNWLRVGEKGCGKTTDNLHWCCRLMEVNEEIVVWRGSPSRSGWLPYRDYATLWLPANADVDARWVFDEEGRRPEAVDDVEALVRGVRYYEDVLELVDELCRMPGGTFNVVYPDPSFAGCREVYAQDPRSSPLPFTPEWRAVDGDGTPLVQWWFAFWMARVDLAENRPFMSLIFDEFHGWMPNDVEQDDHRTYQKTMLFVRAFDDSRRAKLSLFASVHRETKAFWAPRAEFDVRVDMPDGTPNPTSDATRSIPQGFQTVPMFADIMSDRSVGEALMYDQQEFQVYAWEDIKAGAESEDRKLVVDLGEPDEDDEAADESTLEYESALLQRWDRGDHRRLYSKAEDSDGYLDRDTGEVVGDLQLPGEYELLEPETTDDYHLFRARDGAGEELVVARVPIREIGLDDTDQEAVDGDQQRLDDVDPDAGLDESDLDVDGVESASEVLR